MPLNPALSILFPGQGSQEPGMGKDLAEADSGIMNIWKKAESISGIDLRGIYWDGDEAEMANTRNLQPALTVVNIALWTCVAGKATPACTAGHSLGEFSALAAAEALSVDAVLETVSLRGRLMAEADPAGTGTMAAVLKMELADVEAVVRESAEAVGEMIRVANYNTPGQFVLSGTKAAIADAAERVKTRKGRAVPLSVSGAFHSPLMNEAAKELSAHMAKLNWNKPKFPVYCNVNGKAVADAASLKDIMPTQMTSSVMWIDTIRNQFDAGMRTFVEVGPKGVLGKMLGQILKPVADSSEWSSVSVGNREAAQAYLAE
jgi:[acyl-carrier-protein] S-malonyltransferase